MGAERDGGYENVDETTRKAAGICGASQRTSIAAKAAEPVSCEERAQYGEKTRPIEEAALKKWAIENNLWIDESDFLIKYKERKIGAGAEQKVYLKEDSISVLKVNRGRFHTNWLDYFNRLLFHAFLFPATRYTTIGFTEDEGSFAVITEQLFAILDKGASREIVERFLNDHGFRRIKNDDYYSTVLGVKLEDLHDENVFLNEEQDILFIDPVIYFETLDLRLGGQLIFHFPFK